MTRPAPLITEDNEGFWLAAKDQRLVIQKCTTCGALHHPPRPMCPVCNSVEQEWLDATGTGTVYTYALLHHPQHPAFSYPIPAAIIELDEGVRLVSNVVGIDPHEVRIGMLVEVVFETVEDGWVVPLFRPAKSSP